MSEIVKSEYNALDEQGNYKKHYFKTSADQVVGLGRMKNTEYQVGDVVYSDSNLSVALRCTQAGTTSNSELNVSTVSIGNVITDGTVKWQLCNRTSDVTSVNGKTGDVVVDLPVGHMYWSVEPNVPAGRLPALGATYNRALYADLWAWANEVGLVKTESEWQAIASANDGNCAYYSSGDGSTTFRVPKLPNTIASDVPSEVPVVGNGMTLGLTEGTRDLGLFVSNSGNGTGVFSGSASIGTPASSISGANNIGRVIGVTTDPAKSGIVAETSATKINGQWLIVAFGVAHNIGEADVANVMQAVEQVQTSVGTLEQGVGTAIDYIVESYRNGTEWYEVYKSGKVRQGGRLGAVANNGTSNKVTFLKAFANTNYTITVTSVYSTGYCGAILLTTTSVCLEVSGGDKQRNWVAEGQGA